MLSQKMLRLEAQLQVLAFYFRQLAEIESDLAATSEKVQRTLESMTGDEDYTPEDKVVLPCTDIVPFY